MHLPELEGTDRLRVHFVYDYDDDRHFSCEIPYTVLLEMKRQLDEYYAHLYPEVK